MRKLWTLLTTLGVVLIMACNHNLKVKEQPQLDGPPIDSLQLLTTFPADVDESSGLSMIDGIVWTHNDSGSGPVLFQVSSKESKLLAAKKVEGAASRDWEELARDSTYLYIGDFGNNKGHRQDLTIYRVSISDLSNMENEAVSAEKIEFQYPDQTNFSTRPYQHNFDCEAMISMGDSLYLFSKNHQNERCRLYSLPKKPGQYTATLKAEMDTKGVITGADIDPEGKTVALLGYNVYQKMGKYRDKPFVWLLSDFEGTQFFEGTAKRINLVRERQTEGICFGDNGHLIVSSEGEGSATGGLYLFDYSKWIK